MSLDYEAMAAGKPAIPTKVKGSIRPIHNRVIVKNMNFGEQKTAGGIIITSDIEFKGMFASNFYLHTPFLWCD